MLKEMLSNAQTEDMGIGTVHRLLDNDGVPVNYYQSGGVWRLVTSEDNVTLITVEIRYLKKPNKVSKRWRKY